MAYDHDLKRAALAALDRGGETKVGIAKTFGVVRQTLDNWLAERDAERAGTRPPPAKRGPKPKLGAPGVEKLAALVEAQPDGTIAQFHQQLGAPVHPNTVWRALRALGQTFKKRPCGPTSANAPTSPPRGPRGRTASRLG
jgi:transposase